MPVMFREIRIGDLDQALAFAKGQGGAADGKQVLHHLSLTASDDGETLGCALCVEDGAGLMTVELYLGDSAAQQGLGKPLADTVLRKMQAAGVGAVRIVAADESECDRLYGLSNWMDRVPESSAATGVDQTNDAAAQEAEASNDTAIDEPAATMPADAPAAEPAPTA